MLARLSLFSLEKRRLRGKLIENFKILHSFTKVDANKLFSIDNSSRTKDNGEKLKCKQVQVDSRSSLLDNSEHSTKELVPSSWLWGVDYPLPLVHLHLTSLRSWLASSVRSGECSSPAELRWHDSSRLDDGSMFPCMVRGTTHHQIIY